MMASLRAERGTWDSFGCTSRWKLSTAVVSSRASASEKPKLGMRSFSSGCRMRPRS